MPFFLRFVLVTSILTKTKAFNLTMLLEKFTSTDLEDKHKSIELEASEQATYPWHQFKPSCFCGCFNFVLQLVLVGSLGSFLFGFNIALLNTATKTINSSFLQCGGFNSPAYERFQNTPYG